MYPDVLLPADIDADGIYKCCHFICSSVCPTVHGLGFGYCGQITLEKCGCHWGLLLSVLSFVHHSLRFLRVCWQISWKEYNKIWHADISSRYRCRWILLSFYYPRPPSAPTGIDVGHCVHLSVCPERHYHSNSLGIQDISLKFGGIMHSNMKQIAI